MLITERADVRHDAPHEVCERHFEVPRGYFSPNEEDYLIDFDNVQLFYQLEKYLVLPDQ